MQKVLVYGDSNVWGDSFEGPRVPYHLRWVNRLRRMRKIHIVADGLPGRVAGDYRKDKPHKNGRLTYLDALNKARDVDFVIVALGTNDLQSGYSRNSSEIVNDLLWYSVVTKGPKLLYLLPALFEVGERSGPGFTEKSLQLRDEVVAQRHLFDRSLLLDDVPLSDGVHFSPEGHKLVAEQVKREIAERGV